MQQQFEFSPLAVESILSDKLHAPYFPAISVAFVPSISVGADLVASVTTGH